MACGLFWLGAPLPTCRGWMSVRAPIPTTQERLLAPGVAAPPATGAAGSNSGAALWQLWACVAQMLGERKKRFCAPSWAFAEMRISLFGRRVGHFLALRVCVWLEKGLTKAEKEFSGVAVCVCVRECVTVIRRQTRGPCFPLPFLQRIQPSSAHFPRLSRRHPLPSEGAWAVRLQSELQLPPWHTGGVICTEHCGPPQISARRSERGQSRSAEKNLSKQTEPSRKPALLQPQLYSGLTNPDVWLPPLR